MGPYSQAVAWGDLVFVSGQIPLRPGDTAIEATDIESQTEQVLANLAAVLEAADASLASVLRTTVYLIDLAEFPRMNQVYARHFDHEPAPARATVQVAALPLGARVEIDAIAIRSAPPGA